MKEMRDFAILSLAFIFQWLWSFSLDYYFSPKGSIEISHPIFSQGRYISILRIENSSKKFIDGLAIEMPAQIRIKDISSEPQVAFSIATNATNSTNKIIKINQISPKIITRLLIATQAPIRDNAIRVLAAGDGPLSTKYDDKAANPLPTIIFSDTITSIVFIIVMIIAVKASGKHIDNISKKHQAELEKREQEMESARNEIKKIKDGLKEHDNRMGKLRVLMAARTSDYAKELEFWRNAFRKLAVDNGNNLCEANQVIQKITKELKTFGTLDETPEFEVIKIASAWLNEDH